MKDITKVTPRSWRSRFFRSPAHRASEAPSPGRFDSDSELEDAGIPPIFWVVLFAIFGLFFWIYLIAFVIFSVDDPPAQDALAPRVVASQDRLA